MKTVANGLFIVCSGPDGGGKTTQIEDLRSWLESEDYQVLVTRIPEDLSPWGGKPSAHLELLLLVASYCYSLEMVIQPALKEGVIVIVEGYVPDIYARKCFTREFPEDIFRLFFMNFAVGLRMHTPHRTFWFNMPPGVGILRTSGQEAVQLQTSSGLSREEAIANGYTKFFGSIAPEYSPMRIDAEKSKEEIFIVLQEEVRNLINQALSRAKGSAT